MAAKKLTELLDLSVQKILQRCSGLLVVGQEPSTRIRALQKHPLNQSCIVALSVGMFAKRRKVG
eukprot:757730-Hanusia_phi.AAC.2